MYLNKQFLFIHCAPHQWFYYLTGFNFFLLYFNFFFYDFIFFFYKNNNNIKPQKKLKITFKKNLFLIKSTKFRFFKSNFFTSLESAFFKKQKSTTKKILSLLTNTEHSVPTQFFYFLNYTLKTLFTNKIYFIGNVISPYQSELEKKKNWFTKNLVEEVSFKKKNFFELSTKESSLFIKKTYFNNYHYFFNLKINFNDFKHLLKITNLQIKIKNEKPTFYSKPYSILSFSKFTLNQYNPYIQIVNLLYKNYTKLTLNVNKNFFFNQKHNLIGFDDLQMFFVKNIKQSNTDLNSFLNIKNNYLNEKNQEIDFLYKKNTISKNLNNITYNTTSFLKFFYNLTFLFTDFLFLNITYENDISTNTNVIQELIDVKKNFLFLNIFMYLIFFKNIWNTQVKHFQTIYKFNFYLSHIIIKKTFTSLVEKHFKYNLNTDFNFWNFNVIELPKQSINNNNFITTIYNLPFTESNFLNNFSLNCSGFLYTTLYHYLKFDINLFSYNIKKKYYSFSMKNEMQKYILKHYLKNMNNLGLGPFRSLKSSLNIKHQPLFLKHYQYYLNSLNDNQKNFNNFSSILRNFKTTYSPEYFDEINDFKISQNTNYSFFIRKIKFKPGYMNFWREARSVLKEILNLNIKYQYRLSRYLIKFNKILKFKLYLNTEMTLKNILVRSRFFIDWQEVTIFFKNWSIYVNGQNCYNFNLQLYIGDFIQTQINLKYYIFYKWLIHWNNKKKLKLRIKTKRKLTIIETEEDKTKTKVFPKWILLNKNISDDVAKFLEIDFFTMSIFVIYEPFTWEDLNPYSTLWTRFGVINMYNWKYIT